MKQELRIVEYDSQLGIEAYLFQGIMQRFPNHFHEYYVVGFIEEGNRYLSCKGKEFIIGSGDMVIFNPRDVHTCQQIDERALDFRCLNIPCSVMQQAVLQITQNDLLPTFQNHVFPHSDLVISIRQLHTMILKAEKDFRKEEVFLLLISQLLEECRIPINGNLKQEPKKQITLVCEYLKEHYNETISLEILSEIAGLSKYYLLRCFTKQIGITPYSYLETIRIDKAKDYLQQLIPPIEVASLTGFTDQSHFTNFFKKLIGLTPKQYMKIYEEERGEANHE